MARQKDEPNLGNRSSISDADGDFDKVTDVACAVCSSTVQFLNK